MGMRYIVVGITCTQHNLVGMSVFSPAVARWELPRRLVGAGVGCASGASEGEP